MFGDTPNANRLKWSESWRFGISQAIASLQFLRDTSGNWDGKMQSIMILEKLIPELRRVCIYMKNTEGKHE